MKRIVVIVAGLLVASTSAFAQTPDADALDRALSLRAQPEGGPPP